MRKSGEISESKARKVKQVKEQLNSNTILHKKGNGDIPTISDGEISTNSKFDDYEEAIMADHNSMVNEKIDEWDRKNEEVKAVMQKIKDDIKNIDIRPLGNYVLVKPFTINPFSRMTVLENGLVIPEFDPSFKDDGSGDMKEMIKMAEFATVMDVPADNKDSIFVKRNDIVFYQSPESVPIPFYNQGFKLVAIQNIKAVINNKDELDKRVSAE